MRLWALVMVQPTILCSWPIFDEANDVDDNDEDSNDHVDDPDEDGDLSNLVTSALLSYQWQCFCARSVPGMRKVAIHPAALVWNHDGPGILLLWKLWSTICDLTGLPTWHNSLVWPQQNLKTTNILHRLQKIFRFSSVKNIFKVFLLAPSHHLYCLARGPV